MLAHRACMCVEERVLVPKLACVGKGVRVCVWVGGGVDIKLPVARGWVSADRCSVAVKVGDPGFTTRDRAVGRMLSGCAHIGIHYTEH